MDAKATTVLSELLDRGAVKGRVLAGATGMSGDELVDAIEKLVAKDLIYVKGNARDERKILDAFIALRPSASRVAKKMVR